MSGSAVDAARRVLRLEAEALMDLTARLGPSFERAVALLLAAKGRVVVSGVGKSGIVARKIAATLTSTGTPAVFLHPVDALHGDLGIVGPEDVGIFLSKSGSSTELLALLETFGRLGVPVVGLTGRMDSPLAQGAAAAIDVSVSEEACPHNLAPTSSTTVAMAMGDALAVAVLEQRGFRAEDFARLHPGGAIGRRLLRRVKDAMLTAELPTLSSAQTLRDSIVVLAKKRGTAVVVDGSGRLLGVLTAGDLTRRMESDPHFLELTVATVMTGEPKTTEPEVMLAAAVGVMERAGVMCLPVVEEGRVMGVLHLHDALRALA